MSSKETTAAVVGNANRSCLKVTRHSKPNIESFLTDWDDMSAVEMPKVAVEDAYKKHFGVRPGQVHLNDDFCKGFDWLSYNRTGTVKYYDVSIIPKINITGDRYLENDTASPFTHKITLTTTDSNSATTTVTQTSSISFGSKITIGAEELGIGGEFSQTFSLSNEVGSSNTQSSSVEISDTVTVEVPPHSKVRIYLEVKWEERKEDFEIPVTIDSNGFTGAQFPYRVQGHYYWAVAHRVFFTPPFKCILKGSLVAVYNTTGRIVVSEPQPM